MTTEKIELYPLKCAKCKATLRAKPTVKGCPVCGDELPRIMKY